MNVGFGLVGTPKLYSAGSALYEWLTTHPLQARAIEALSACLPSSGCILDVCCGPGVILQRILTAGPERKGSGLDAASGAVERARARGLDAHAGRAEAMPFEDGAFDAAYISGALYLLPDPQAVLFEMRRVSKARVLVLEAAPALRTRLALNPGRKLGLRARLDVIVWNAAMKASRRYDPSSLRADMEAAGLSEVEVHSVVDDLYLIAEGACT